MTANTKTLLMDAAEIGIRQKGYNAVSFRELADELSIKSASVHYHFRKKEDLGLALVDRYSQQFFEALNARANSANTPEEKLRAFCDTYRDSLVNSDAICLCGILGAESASLPQALSNHVTDYFAANIKWLTDALPADWDTPRKQARAAHILATLQGAMMLSTSMKDTAIFDQSVENLLSM